MTHSRSIERASTAFSVDLMAISLRNSKSSATRALMLGCASSLLALAFVALALVTLKPARP